MLLAGMVGSNRGWRETPYRTCPAGAAEIAQGIVWVDQNTGIVPGVCQRGPAGADVMRGEEVQVIGAVAAGLIAPETVVCHPGTHAKWIEIEGGRIPAFRTMMTGEVFGLLCAHSILADLLEGKARVGPGFEQGVTAALAGEPPLSELFRIRARFLLEGDAADAASRASGILIGSEVAWAVRQWTTPRFALIGRPELCELYAAAIRLAGRESLSVDGAAAFLAGIDELTRMLP
jgi:2-dehydro-3-deoxygalactonokinase